MSFDWQSIDYTKPLVMGILNVTPDSFFDGGSYTTKETILRRFEAMIQDGADIIDIGAYSSRPGAEDISAEEEFERLKFALTIAKEKFPQIPISIDTFRLAVIKNVLDFYGPVMVNDISGGNYDAEMMRFCADNNLPFVCMHMQGTPQTMQIKPQYINVVSEVLDFFKKKIEEAQTLGLTQFIIDPGFGFGKTVEQNYELLNNLEKFVELGYPVFVGVSRKSMIQRVIDCTAKEALNGTTVLNTISLLKGAKIIRVHDVREAKEAVMIVGATTK